MPEKIIPLKTALFPPSKLTDPYYDWSNEQRA
jgi:hypothetical protein